MLTIGDSAWPPPTYPQVDGWGFYLGGNTPHPWTDREVAAIPTRCKLPIWTRSNPQGTSQAQADADLAGQRAMALGQPAGTLIALDFESAVNGAYVSAFDAQLHTYGYSEILYGGASTLFLNPRPSGGYWAADWTRTPHLVHGSVATQYISDQQLGRPYDLSVALPDLPLWGNTDPAPAPVEEEDMNASSTINPGNMQEAGLSWGTGSRHVVQVVCDGTVRLRVVLEQTTGPWVAPQPLWTVRGRGTYEIPEALVPNCSGIVLEAQDPNGAPFYVTAV